MESSIFDIPVNWKKVSQIIDDFSESSILDKIVDQRMEAIIKKKHPNDYVDFIENNKEVLTGIKERIKLKYSLEFKQKSEQIYSPQY